MDARLVQLLGSFVGARNQYTLARLEFAMRHPRKAPPPVIDRLLEPSERALREDWPHLEEQLERALSYLKTFEGNGRPRDPAFRRLRLCVRELDQYARAIRWVLTVTET
jgi:hypothetical protein